MLKLTKTFLPLVLLTVFHFSFAPQTVAAAGFVNPLLNSAEKGCQVANLKPERFNPELTAEERVKMCHAIDKIAGKLNETVWSAALSAELQGIWNVFSNESVRLRLLPKGTTLRMLAMAEPFPSGVAGDRFEANVYLRPEKSNSDSFFQVLLHELRHVYDFHETWKNRTKLNSIELERQAFLLMGKIAQETPERENFSNLPKFWKDSWAKLSPTEISARRAATVDKYLQDNKFYRQLAQNQDAQALDFSYLKNSPAPNELRQTAVNYNKKDGERIPDRPVLPQTSAPIQQKIQELSFNLETPKNPRDEKEVLRVALANEKKLYYGMSNFVYDQKLNFQCWQKGKVAASISENNTITRSDNGTALYQAVSMPPAVPAAASPCTLDSRNLKTDFTETFWVSPALEKMPIRFAGFVDAEGKTLARYTVLQPDERLFNQLANEYSYIKPFRVFVGTIFVSPEDGQIVKFWGTSFPEDTVTGFNAKKVWGSYSVTALRQKLNIDRGLWVTVYVGTVAVANLSKNPRPFSYTVKFENYRQSITDVKIIDDEQTAQNTFAAAAGGSR